MSQLTAKTRIALGLASLLAGVLLSAIALGFLPDHRVAVMKGRSDLCEAIAINSSVYLTRSDVRRVETLLEAVVQRNPDLLSAALRRKGGTLVAEIGPHTANWVFSGDKQATETQVQVPIRSGRKDWGTVEMRFRPLSEAGMWGFLRSPWCRFVVYACGMSLMVFMLYLGKMLQHLNPSKAVPSRVREALDTLTEGLLVMDKDERIVLANKAFAETVGEDSDDLQGRKASELPWRVHGEEENEGVDRVYPWCESIDSGVRRTGVMIGMRDCEQAERTFVCNSSPVCGKDGQDAGVLASFEDVTPLQRTKEKLEESKIAADAANQAKSEFLAGMSHEIRTPLNAILGFADVLRRGYEDGEAQRHDYLNTIHSSGQHLLTLINDVLDLSKIEAGKLEMERSPCSPHQILFDVVGVLSVKTREKGISLTYESDGEIPEVILSDAGRLRQAVMNLVGNAVKFTETGGVRIVSRFLPDAENPKLEIAVIDTGIGMSPATQDRIFDPFVQADSSITRRFGGTGLGLAISRRFAAALGGDLAVHSVEGEGSTFTVTIDVGPVDDVRFVDSRSAKASVREQPTSDDQAQLKLSSCRVLVVEDGTENQKLMRLVLSRAGATVETADNGQLGVEAATASQFDVVLMDMQMPVMDGYTATRTLREQGFDSPIIALTANALKGDEEKCRAAGCSDFLTKPINIDLLLRTVAEAAGASLQAVQPPSATASQPEASQSSVAGSGIGEPRNAAVQRPPLISTLPTDDPEFCEVVVEFIGKLNDKLDQMEAAESRGDFAELAALAHWLKGSGGTAGFGEFTEPAAHLEQLAKSEQREAIGPAIAALEELTARIQSPQSDQSPVAATNCSTIATTDLPLVSTLPTEDPDFCEIVVEFIERLDEKLSAMREAWSGRDMDELASLAHWLKGSGGTAGFADFTEPAAGLEEMAKQRQTDGIEQALAGLEQLASRIKVPDGSGMAAN